MSTPMVLETDPAVWRDQVLDLIDAKCRRGERFTSDDLHEVGEPPHPNAWGAAIRTAKVRRMIRPVATAYTRRRSGHGRIVHTWEPDPQTYRPEAA